MQIQLAPAPPPRGGREVLERVLATLRAEGCRVTTPRRLLLECLISAGSLRTAEELATEVHRRAPDVHLSTIYRNLDELERLQIVVQQHLSRGAATYHLVANPNGHLVCTDCGRAIEVAGAFFASLEQAALLDYGFEVDPLHLSMVGRCAACSAVGDS